MYKVLKNLTLHQTEPSRRAWSMRKKKIMSLFPHASLSSCTCRSSPLHIRSYPEPCLSFSLARPHAPLSLSLSLPCTVSQHRLLSLSRTSSSPSLPADAWEQPDPTPPLLISARERPDPVPPPSPVWRGIRPEGFLYNSECWLLHGVRGWTLLYFSDLFILLFSSNACK